jgi:hypothetical protein
MNGEKQLKAFIDKPCKATLMPFVKSLFTAKQRERDKKILSNKLAHRRSLMTKAAAVRYKLDRCDILRRGTPFAKCEGCPFQIEIEARWAFTHKATTCFFVHTFGGMFNPAMRNQDIYQHQWPKAMMQNIGYILMGAVKLQNALELRKEEKKNA